MDCISDGSNERLFSRIDDTVELAQRRCCPCFLGFLDLREQAVLSTAQSQLPDGWRLYGGYSEAERKIFVAYPDFYDEVPDEDFPIATVAFRYRSGVSLSHRDFLGTLLSVGIRRDKVGDILCGDGLTVVFLRAEIAEYVCEQIDRVGGEGVTLIPDYSGELPIQHRYEESQDTIASARLDVVVKTLIRCSRERAAELIRLGCVSVNHLPQPSVSASVSAPCTISVRGYGRYIVDQIGPQTKKGRLLFLSRKCI